MTRFTGSIVVADLETTDKEIETAGICQAAALNLFQHQNGEWMWQPLFQSYCSPCEPMKPEALAVHGITPDKYKYAPTDSMMMWVFKAIIDALGSHVILSGYNCTRYDYPIMDKCYAVGTFTTLPQIDVMTLFLRLEPEKDLKLVDVYERYFGSDDLLTSAHDALADITMTARLLELYLTHYKTNPLVLAEWCATPMEMPVMPYGKYKGKPFDGVPHSYLEWMAAKWTDMHPDLACTLRRRGYL